MITNLCFPAFKNVWLSFLSHYLCLYEIISEKLLLLCFNAVLGVRIKCAEVFILHRGLIFKISVNLFLNVLACFKIRLFSCFLIPIFLKTSYVVIWMSQFQYLNIVVWLLYVLLISDLFKWIVSLIILSSYLGELNL